MRKESFQIEKGKVALISGGGSGHEPFCAGYIGEIRDISEILVDILVTQALPRTVKDHATHKRNMKAYISAPTLRNEKITISMILAGYWSMV